MFAKNYCPSKLSEVVELWKIENYKNQIDDSVVIINPMENKQNDTQWSILLLTEKIIEEEVTPKTEHIKMEARKL